MPISRFALTFFALSFFAHRRTYSPFTIRELRCILSNSSISSSQYKSRAIKQLSCKDLKLMMGLNMSEDEKSEGKICCVISKKNHRNLLGSIEKNRGDRSGVLINFQNSCPGRWTAAKFDAKLLLGLSSKKPTMDTFRRPWTVFSLDDFLPKTMTTLLSRGLYILFLCSNDSYLFLRKEILSIYVHYLIFYLIYAPGRMIAFIWAQNSFFVPPQQQP